MSDPGLRATRVWRSDARHDDTLVVEEPLEIHVDGHPLAVLLRTPGEDEDLAAGFLATEGVIDDLDDLLALGPCQDPNRRHAQNLMLARLAPGVRGAAARVEAATRAVFTSSSCGLCGKRTIDHILQNAPPLAAPLHLSAAVLAGLPDALAAAQPRFRRTGGLHGAALVTPEGAVLCAREDVGRHNAVDKVLGAQLRADRWPLEGLALVVSSRAGFEIVQKALVARVGAVVAVGAASSMAEDLAVRGGMALYSFVRGDRFNRHGSEPDPRAC
jgi:FdhD protein